MAEKEGHRLPSRCNLIAFPYDALTNLVGYLSKKQPTQMLNTG